MHAHPDPETSEYLPPALDHIVVMLDADAYRDLNECDLLDACFGRVQVKKATSSLAGTYTALGVAAENTLLEFFDVSAPPLPGITGGMVFSYDRPGSIQRARTLLDATGLPDVTYELVRRAVADGAEEQAWYHLIRPELGTGNPFLLMIAEVTPQYFAHLGARPGPAGRLLRRDYLDAAFGRPASPDHLFSDVTEVIVRLRPERAAPVTAMLRALGYRDRVAGDETVLQGPGITVRVSVDPIEPEGVRSVRLALRRPRDGHWAYGATSSLAFRGDRTAEWLFTPPAIPTADAGDRGSGETR